MPSYNNYLSFSRHYGSPEQAATETFRPFKTDAEAKAARDVAYRLLKAEGKDVRRSVLKNQLRHYWAFGVHCGIMADCYEIFVDRWRECRYI